MNSSPTQEFVDAFALTMEAKLEENRHKGDRPGWLLCAQPYLIARLAEEVGELAAAVLNETADIEDVRREAADVGNFAMMIADKYAHDNQ